MIGLEKSRHLLSQSDAKLKQMTTWSLALSLARGRLHMYTSNSHWLPVIITFVLISLWDYFGFGIETINRKALYNVDDISS